MIEKKYLVFELSGSRFGVDVTELAVIANECSFLGYDGLPEHVLGLVHYAGKVYPVLNFRSIIKDQIKDQHGAEKKPLMYLFSNKLVDSDDPKVLSEFAIPIYSDVKMSQIVATADEIVFKPNKKNNADYVVCAAQDSDGDVFDVISLTKISSMFS